MNKYLPKLFLVLVFSLLTFFFVSYTSSVYAQYADPGTGCGGCPEGSITYGGYDPVTGVPWESATGSYVMDTNGNLITYDVTTFDVTQGFTSQVGVVTSQAMADYLNTLSFGDALHAAGDCGCWRGTYEDSGGSPAVSSAPGTGVIQGYKVLMPGNDPATTPPLIANQIVRLDGLYDNSANPYSYTVSTPFTVSVTVPANYTVGYTLCFNLTNCHNPSVDPVVFASSVLVNPPVGGWADLWWHFYPTCSVTVPGTNQFTGCLWDGTNFNFVGGDAPAGPVLSSPVQDSVTAMDFDWGLGAPNVAVGVDTFSARWRGEFNFKGGGFYTFYAGADDGIMVRIDGVTRVDSWIDTGYFERTFTLTMPAGVHRVEVDFYENGGLARASLRWVYTPPNTPINLTVSGLPSCALGPYDTTTFSWLNASQTGWVADVDTDVGFSWPWYYKNLDYGVNSTSVPAGFAEVGSGNPLTLMPGTTYYWRIWNSSFHTYPPSSLTAPGTPFTVPLCPDLDLLDVQSEFQFYSDLARTSIASNFEPGKTIYVRVKTLNSGGDISGPFRIGFYIDRQTASPQDPSCGTAPDPPPPPSEKLFSNMAAGFLDTWEFEVNAPLSEGLKRAYAFADYQCSLLSLESDRADNIRFKAYSVAINSWFESLHGDAGSPGTISVSQTTFPAGRYQSEYMLVGGDLVAPVISQSWSIDNYTKNLVPSGGVYNYFADRFRKQALDQSAAVCTPAGNLPSSFPASIVACGGNAVYGGSGNVSGPTGVYVIFIDGNLTIRDNLMIPPNASETVYVVSGNITVESDVGRIDGVFITDGVFTDANTSPPYGPRLEVKGAVYARTLDLTRKLDPTLITIGLVNDPYNSVYTPTETFNYDPKYIDALNTILGSAAVSWKEIEP